ncbi:hypothetical protein D3C78_1486010 [compost metagenome]
MAPLAWIRPLFWLFSCSLIRVVSVPSLVNWPCWLLSSCWAFTSKVCLAPILPVRLLIAPIALISSRRPALIRPATLSNDVTLRTTSVWLLSSPLLLINWPMLAVRLALLLITP